MSKRTLLQEIQNLSTLPSPPEVALQIIEIVRDPDKGASDLGEVLSMDQAVSAKVLRVSNSSAYARSREVVTITDAVTLLGSKTVSVIALAFSVKDAIPDSECGGLSTATLWRHTVSTAIVARALSRVIGANDELASLCGLLSRVGQLVFVSCMAEKYSPIVGDALEILPSHTEEIACLGIGHHDVSQVLLEKWQLPDSICNTVRCWGTDEALSLDVEQQQLCKVIEVADAARALFFEENKSEQLTRLNKLAEEAFGLPPNEVARILATCDAELDATMSLFGDGQAEKMPLESILAQANEQMMMASVEIASNLNSLSDENEQLAQTNEELKKKSLTDALTGLANRLALNEELAALAEPVESGKQQPYSLVMIDIDKFKTLNDTYGHDVGDQVLRSVGKSLAASARATDFVARYGGEEFTVVLHGCDEHQAISVAERFRIAVSSRGIELGDKTLFVTASAGVATNDGSAETTEEVLCQADKALYEAKNSGRDQTVSYRSTLRSNSHSVQSIASRLRNIQLTDN